MPPRHFAIPSTSTAKIVFRCGEARHEVQPGGADLGSLQREPPIPQVGVDGGVAAAEGAVGLGRIDRAGVALAVGEEDDHLALGLDVAEPIDGQRHGVYTAWWDNGRLREQGRSVAEAIRTLLAERAGEG